MTKITDKNISSLKNQKNETWIQRVEKDGITECINVEKLSNKGFLVTLSKHGYKGDKYIDASKKMYSDTNPLEDLPNENPFTQLFNTLAKDR